MPMSKCLYVGTDPRFVGKTALVRYDSELPTCLAQFDNRNLPEAYGWHLFNEADFLELRVIGADL